MDPKRRACLVLQAIIEGLERDGTRTLAPAYLLWLLLDVSQQAHPEALIDPRHLDRFFQRVTTHELQQLMAQYPSEGLVDLLTPARRELERRTSSG